MGRSALIALMMATASCGAAACAQPPEESEHRGGDAGAGGEAWARIARDVEGPEDPSSDNVCNRGEPACLNAVVREMRRRLAPLVAACDHRAAFAFMYLRVTETVGDEVAARFDDRGYLNHLDAVFAELYFNAYDAFDRGDLDRVPTAWRVAFDAAAQRQVTGLGDMLLGMNAHISRDLPFALEEIGLETAEGQSGRPDYDRVNGLLAAVQEPMLADASRLLDPSIQGFELRALDFRADDIADLLGVWRSEAFRNAQLLLAARTPAAREAVVERIERNGESRARVLQAALSYALLGETTEERDRFCAARARRDGA